MIWRRVAAAAVAALALAGTLWGEDDDFPFGPVRMYATSARATGTVRTAELWGIHADGSHEVLEAGDVGLRRAELEGQLPRFRAEPALLGALADDDHVAVRLVERVRRVVDRELQDDGRFEVVSEWRR